MQLAHYKLQITLGLMKAEHAIENIEDRGYLAALDSPTGPRIFLAQYGMTVSIRCP